MTTDKSDIAEQLERLAKLRADGVLSDEEFAQLKAKLITDGIQAPPTEAAKEPSPQVTPPANKHAPRAANKASQFEWRGVPIFVTVCIAVLIVFIVGVRGCSTGSPSTNQSAQNTDQTDTQTAESTSTNSSATSGAPPVPDDEAKFISAVSTAQSAYDAAPNEMAKGATRAVRRNAICQALQNSTAAGRWVGTIKTLSSNTDGKGVLEVSIAPNVSVETMNNELSDIGHGTLLAPDSAVFKTASAMKEGDTIIFSGNFFPVMLIVSRKLV